MRREDAGTNDSVKQSMRAQVYGVLLLAVAFNEETPAPARPGLHASNVFDTTMHCPRGDAHPLVHILRPPARGDAVSGGKPRQKRRQGRQGSAD